MSSKSSKRKITVEKGSSGSRPSVFERLGTKAEQREQNLNNSGFCRHWNNTGNCPFGSSCKNAMFHTLISPSKQRAASKDREHISRLNKQQVGAVSRSSVSRLHSTIISVKGSGTPPPGGALGEAGPAGQWEEDWSLDHADEKELERRRLQLQKELELQMKKELRRRKLAASTSSSAKKGSRSSSSSSSSSSGSSSSSSGSSSDGSSSSRGRASKGRGGSSKQRSKKGKHEPSKSSTKDIDLKKVRDSSRDTKKREVTHQSSSMTNRQRPSAGSKRRRESSSPDSSGSDRRKQSRGPGNQHAASTSRGRGRSPSPDRKIQQDRKRQALSHDKGTPGKRRDGTPPSHKSSMSNTRGVPRKRSVTPPQRLRRRSPSPTQARRRSPSPAQGRRRSPSPMQTRRRSPSPGQTRRRSPSPSQARRRSPSPGLSRRRSQSPAQSRRRSPSPGARRRSPSPSIARRRSPSPGMQRRRSPSPSQSRRRSPSPNQMRRRSPSPSALRNRGLKAHVYKTVPGSSSRNASPAVPRRRSTSVERKDTRRGHTPPSPPIDRGYQQRGGRNSRRNSPELQHRGQQRDVRQRPPPGRGNDRQSPERRTLLPRASSPMDNKRGDWNRGRDYAGSPPPRGHHRSSPDSSNGSNRGAVGRDLRGEVGRDKSRIKEHDRDRRLPMEKGREKMRGRGDEGELPSLLSIMTQHPPHFPPQPPAGNRARPPPPRDEPLLDHRGIARDRGRFERYEGDRGGDNFMEHGGDDHHRGVPKRGPPRREINSPPRQTRPQKPREWNEYPESRPPPGGREWDRRTGAKGAPVNVAAPQRQWGPPQIVDEAARANRMLPPLSVRNAMQAARRGGETSPSQPGAASASPSTSDSAPTQKTIAETASIEKPAVGQDEAVQESEKPKEPPVKRPHEDSDADDGEAGEPDKKKICVIEPHVASPSAGTQSSVSTPSLASAAPAPSMDLMESDLSDISDDADDILNAEGAEEAVEPNEKAEAAGDDDEEDRVEDMLDNLDFEDVSDGELEAEEARGEVDALTVDWAALLSQTRSQSQNEDAEAAREARSHRWQAHQVLARIGVSLKLCGPQLAQSLGIIVPTEINKEKNANVEGQDSEEAGKEKIKLLHSVAGVHVALKTRKLQRESIFQLRDRRGLSASDDLSFRRQLNGLPAKKSGHQFNRSADPELGKIAVQLLKTST